MDLKSPFVAFFFFGVSQFILITAQKVQKTWKQNEWDFSSANLDKPLLRKQSE